MKTPDNYSTQRYGAVALAMLFMACALWRVFIAFEHYRLSLGIHDDPSIRELEQVSAAIETAIALVLAAHVVALWFISRRPFEFHWPLALCIAALCALALVAALSSVPPAVYIVSVMAGSAVLSQLLMFNWISLYIGAVSGSTLACFAAAPATDILTCFFIVAPCVAWVLLGAGLGRLFARVTRRGYVS